MGATNQRTAELHNIKLCGRPCPRKNPTHNIISRMIIAIAAFLRFIISSYKEALFWLLEFSTWVVVITNFPGE